MKQSIDLKKWTENFIANDSFLVSLKENHTLRATDVDSPVYKRIRQNTHENESMRKLADAWLKAVEMLLRKNDRELALDIVEHLLGVKHFSSNMIERIDLELYTYKSLVEASALSGATSMADLKKDIDHLVSSQNRAYLGGTLQAIS